MADLQQLETALRNADAAGDVQAATILANEIRRMKPASVEAGQAVNSIPRQLGLTARYAVEGLANNAQLFTEPIRAVTDRLTGNVGKTKPLGAVATEMLDRIGVPSPQTADERVVGDATRMVAGVAGMGGLAQRAGGVSSDVLQFAGRNAPATMQTAGQRLAQQLGDNMPPQLAAAAGAGAAGGASREAGASPLMQAGASLLGGVAGGLGASAVGNMADRAVATVKNALPGQQQLIQQRIDQRINIALQTQGIDPATITPAMRTALREQVQRATNTGGQLNPEAVARLADYTRLGMTPTRARLTLDPYDVTQEQNAAKLAAAIGARDSRLPEIAQENNRRLIGLIDEMGGARPADPYGQGSAVTGTVQAVDRAMNDRVSSLYSMARDSSGRSFPLDGRAFTVQASKLLDDNLVGGALPTSVQTHLNRIASGEVPFTVDYAEQLKTAIGNLQRATNDGSQRMALGLVRQALDDTPILGLGQQGPAAGARAVNPGNLPAVPNQPNLGEEAVNAFNTARQAARQRFNWRESSRGIERALEGANADTFIQQNIISRAAGLEDVARLADVVNRNPAAREAVRTSIIQHLKDASIGKGGTSQTGNFSGRNVEAALKDIGTRKLGLFFEPGEIETLRAMARTGAFEVFQPRGSAVNNSNTAAGVGALISSISDRVRPVASKIPLGEFAISRPLDNIALWAMQRPTGNIPRSLLMPRPQPPLGTGLLLPAAAAGGTAAGLLAAP